MNQQRKTKRFGPVPMRDDASSEYQVITEADFMRQQFGDDTWTDWTKTARRYRTTGGEPVTPTADAGVFELAALGTQIRPVARQA